MKVNRLSMHNFRAFRHLNIDFSDRLTVLVGINGVGKSSILNALAILLSRLIWRIRSTKSTGRMFSRTDITSGANRTDNTIAANILDRHITWTVSKNKTTKKDQRITNLSELNNLVGQIKHSVENDENYNIPLALFYSVNRAIVRIELRMRKTHVFERLSAYEDALTNERHEADFRLFFEWFRNREDLENENFRHNNSSDPSIDDIKEFPDRQLQAVRTALERLMPEFSGLTVRRDPLRMVVQKQGKEFKIEQLSDGEKCLLALVGDMARRLAMANPGLLDPLMGEGVVLIDEIELHLHPSWQRIILPRLLGTFPNCQFIVSTHSPLVLTEISPDDIRILHYDGDVDNIICSIPQQAVGLDAKEILEQLMEVTTRNDEINSIAEDIAALIDEENFPKARERLEILKGLSKGTTPDIVRYESLIFMLDDTNNNPS